MSAVQKTTSAGSVSPRFQALDVFRGASVCVMIVVNSMGPGPNPFPWLVHATWFGFTLADLVFPSFLFAMGAALSFTIGKALDEPTFLLKAARRTVLIFLLGYLMYWYPFVHLTPDGHLAGNPLGETRIMGVLQRIALCFALASLAARYLPERALALLCAVLLVGYWGVLLWFGKPGDVLGPFGNAAGQVDRALLGAAHMYHAGQRGYDPEGLIGTLPAVANVLGGYLAARFLARTPDRARAAIQLCIVGVVLVATALLWSVPFPFAKRLWTSSFTLLTIGLDLALLAGLIAYIDLKRGRVGVGFFEVFGKNPLAIYLFSELFLETLQVIQIRPGENPYDYIGMTVFQALAPGPVGALACAVVYMLVCWGFGYILQRRNIVIRI